MPFDAVLNLSVGIAHMEAAVFNRVLGHAGRLREDVAQAGVLALRQLLDRLFAEVVAATPGFRREVVARAVEAASGYLQRQRLLGLD